MFNPHREKTIRDFQFEAEPQVRSNVTKEGTRKVIDAIDASTWVKRGDRWVCAMHTEALASPKTM